MKFYGVIVVFLALLAGSLSAASSGPAAASAGYSESASAGAGAGYSASAAAATHEDTEGNVLRALIVNDMLRHHVTFHPAQRAATGEVSSLSHLALAPIFAEYSTAAQSQSREALRDCRLAHIPSPYVNQVLTALYKHNFFATQGYNAENKIVFNVRSLDRTSRVSIAGTREIPHDTHFSCYGKKGYLIDSESAAVGIESLHDDPFTRIAGIKVHECHKTNPVFIAERVNPPAHEYRYALYDFNGKVLAYFGEFPQFVCGGNLVLSGYLPRVNGELVIMLHNLDGTLNRSYNLGCVWMKSIDTETNNCTITPDGKFIVISQFTRLYRSGWGVIAGPTRLIVLNTETKKCTYHDTGESVSGDFLRCTALTDTHCLVEGDNNLGILKLLSNKIVWLEGPKASDPWWKGHFKHRYTVLTTLRCIAVRNRTGECLYDFEGNLLRVASAAPFYNDQLCAYENAISGGHTDLFSRDRAHRRSFTGAHYDLTTLAVDSTSAQLFEARLALQMSKGPTIGSLSGEQWGCIYLLEGLWVRQHMLAQTTAPSIDLNAPVEGISTAQLHELFASLPDKIQKELITKFNIKNAPAIAPDAEVTESAAAGAGSGGASSH